MIGTITGILSAKTETGILVETGGIGYEIQIPGNSHFHLEREGAEITVHTALIVREDDLSLYGFDDRSSLALFRQLITVSGVGAKAAMSLISAMTADDVRRSIVFEDAASLTRAPGIGKKTAQRIVLDLKDKLSAHPMGTDAPRVAAGAGDAPQADNPRAEALAALTALGYSRGEAANALAGIPDNDLSAEAYIKQALKKLY
jgi:Holliday junction DNA helicase RuvA